MAGITSQSGRPRPKQTAIIEDIRSRIVSGELAPGAQLPTLAVMQRVYDVSDPTIQKAVRYLRDRGFVRTQKRSGMFVADSQYFIAIENEVKHLAETEVSADGLKRKFVFFNEIEGPPEDTERHHHDLFEAVESELVGGLIFVGPPVRFHNTAVLKNPNVPCVGTIVFTMPGIISVSSKANSIVEKALKVLASRGRKRVALITERKLHDEKTLAENFVFLAEKKGLESHPWWVQGTSPSAPEWAKNCTELLFRARPADRPDAVIIEDDNLVPYATAGLTAANVRVPGHVEVIAQTNFPYPTHSEVPVIRMGFDVRKMLKMSVELIEPACDSCLFTGETPVPLWTLLFVSANPIVKRGNAYEA